MPRTAELFIAVNSKDRVSGTENKVHRDPSPPDPKCDDGGIDLGRNPNTLYPSQLKYLYFLVHVNTGYTTDTTIPATDVGGLYLCQAIVPEGVYSHGDAAVSLTQTMGVVKVYPVNKTMTDGTHLAANIVNEVNQTTDDIEIVRTRRTLRIPTANLSTIRRRRDRPKRHTQRHRRLDKGPASLTQRRSPISRTILLRCRRTGSLNCRTRVFCRR